MNNELIKKYSITEQDLYKIASMEAQKVSANFFEKEKLKGKILGVLKPYNVAFMDLGTLLKEIKTGGYHKNQDSITQYGTVDIKAAKSSMGLKIILPLIILVTVVVIYVNPFATKVDPCDCADVASKAQIIGYNNLTSIQQGLYKDCEKKYTTSGAAYDACVNKHLSK